MPTIPYVARRSASAAPALVAAQAPARPTASRYAGAHPPVPEPDAGLPTAENATAQLLTLANPAAWLK